MNKFKKFYKEHRIFVILMGIVLICLIIMIFSLLKYFFFGNAKSAPKRTCDEIQEGVRNDFVNSLKEDSLVKDATIRVSDKSNVVYVTIKYEATASLVEAQSKAVLSLDKLTENDKSCYDFQFMLEQDASENNEGFKIMGSLNSSGTNFSWNNNNTKVEVN